jgi:hypothetical protein
VAYFELTIGFGIGFGPTLGHIMNTLVGNSLMFFAITLIYAFYWIPLVKTIPDDDFSTQN